MTRRRSLSRPVVVLMLALARTWPAGRQGWRPLVLHQADDLTLYVLAEAMTVMTSGRSCTAGEPRWHPR